MANITGYLYNKYGKYRKIDEEVAIIIKTLYDPAVKEEGKREGRIEGIKEGERKGRVRKAQEDILNAIKLRFDTVPDNLKNRISKINDEDKLDEILVAVIKSNSIDEVYKVI